jgi:aminobenzoyl-glutamate utilization protein B
LDQGERGRSALDAVMLVGNGLEFMREHIPSNSRVHYVITNGGAAPNVVPETAEMYLYARNPSAQVLAGVWDRILRVAQGAELMTDTNLEIYTSAAPTMWCRIRQLVADAKVEFKRQLNGATWKSAIAFDQKPPLDYRKH